MNSNTFFSTVLIPLTHLLLAALAGTIGTIGIAYAGYTWIVISLYTMSALLIGMTHAKQWFLPLICATFCSGIVMIHMYHATTAQRSDHYFLKKYCTVEGTITGKQSASLIKEQTTLFITTRTIQYRKKISGQEHTIALYIPSSLGKKYEIGDLIKSDNLLLEQPAEGSEYYLYCLKEGIWATARGSQHTRIELLQRSNSYIKHVIHTLYALVPYETWPLFEPLFLGKRNKNYETIEIQHHSSYWGIAHHMARSGIHVVLLLGLLMAILHYTYIPFSMRYLLALVLLIGYALISQSSISFIRALSMIILQIIARLRNRYPSSIHTITLVALSILLWNPMQLLFLDFQLTFGITYAIIWLFAVRTSKTAYVLARSIQRYTKLSLNK